MIKSDFNTIDLFSGCGGLSEGLKQAGFNVIAAVDIDRYASKAYSLNHPETRLFVEDIRKLDTNKIKVLLNGEPLHLLAGCPPCQGFSAVRRLNRIEPIYDSRNDLILDYFRFIKELKPITIMMENVPLLREYPLFTTMVSMLEDEGYHISRDVVNMSNYGVPQRRKRLVMIGSRIGEINIAKGRNVSKTVRDMIENFESVETTNDIFHKIYPEHSDRIQRMISEIPKDGGSRKDLPKKYWLSCHRKPNVGFNDVYGRLAWDSVSSTITGGCLNPSKGRFIHPQEDRCITAREAAMLQTFPRDYKFPCDIPKSSLALLIGNALPPAFCKIQAEHIKDHLANDVR
ncbi:MAG: DNA cytosine methyltransferase [Calditrichaeota bacterium]|nr:DNA cytosine methyltransferase [Calditrichota bacterium]